ncbi:MAG: hypothetical protein P4M15_12980 [Alphaproteobacteria bacterium]|nr:hypothetical protein [Alphaproteobacteria bacterium]
MGTLVDIFKRKSTLHAPREPFIIDADPARSSGATMLLKTIANDLTRRIPSLANHNVTGADANHLRLRGGRPATVEIDLGPKCGTGNCSGGKAGQDATVDAISDYMAQRPEVKAGGMHFVVRNTAREILAQG